MNLLPLLQQFVDAIDQQSAFIQHSRANIILQESKQQILSFIKTIQHMLESDDIQLASFRIAKVLSETSLFILFGMIIC